MTFDTESINLDHHLMCGGWLNFEFSKKSPFRAVPVRFFNFYLYFVSWGVVGCRGVSRGHIW